MYWYYLLHKEAHLVCRGACEPLIFRITQKLTKKIKVVPAAAMPPHANPFLDWTAHLFMVSRWQCILLTNSQCLYSVVIAGKGVANEKAFLEQGVNALRDYMAIDGCESIFDTHLAHYPWPAMLCKAGDRRVLGSMNDLIYQAKGYLLEVGLPLPFVNMRLNETPMSMLDHRHPKTALLALEGQLKP